jgi:hypothetical protein
VMSVTIKAKVMQEVHRPRPVRLSPAVYPAANKACGHAFHAFTGRLRLYSNKDVTELSSDSCSALQVLVSLQH